MFEESKGIAGGSEWVFPSNRSPKQAIAHGALNVAVRALGIEVRDFVIHDFRRTASTPLHEAEAIPFYERNGFVMLSDNDKDESTRLMSFHLNTV